MTFEELRAIRAKAAAFAATETGRLFNAFVGAHARAWQLDTQAGCQDSVSDKRLREAWSKEKEAREAFIAHLEGLRSK